MISSRTSLFTTFTLLIATIINQGQVHAAPAQKRADSSDYLSLYYEWVPVEYEKCKSWDAYKNYNLVKADSYNLDKVDIYVCLVQFPKDKSYRIGWFDPSSPFVCTVVYQGEAVEASNDDYKSWYLSTLHDYEAKWATWDELINYDDAHVVYAPDHDCLPAQVCWTKSSGKGGFAYTEPSGEKTDKWVNHDKTPSKWGKRSWTRRLGRRQDYEPEPEKDDYKPPQEYAPPEEYCYIGYGSSVSQYKAFYAYNDKAYQSEDIRYTTDVKVLIIEYTENDDHKDKNVAELGWTGIRGGSGSTSGSGSGSGSGTGSSGR